MATIVLSITLCALIMFVFARNAKPACNQSGQTLNSRFATTTNHQPNTLSVASFNIQTGKSLAGKRDITASARVLASNDLVGVQEVYASGWLNRLGVGQSQTACLAQHGSFAYLFCATRRRWFREHRGNALLSKLAVSDWKIQMLPDQSGKSYRNMTIAKVHWQGESFHLINTHLHTREGREVQLAVVLNEFAKYTRAILVGDFNSTASSPLLQQALCEAAISDAITLAGLDTSNCQRIDWILTKGFVVNHGIMMDKGISDHPYYQVNLSYL